MRSSTFSFERESVPIPWTRVFYWALLIAAAFVFSMELRLAAKGFRSTVRDSEALWVHERLRASELGPRAILVVGGSRIQLGLDLAVLRQSTGHEPVELAIDGSPPLRVLEYLASDPKVTGTIIVDYYDHMLNSGPERTTADRYQEYYERTVLEGRGSYLNRVEEYLDEQVRRSLRAYADGARPLDSLLMRVLNPNATPQYLITLPDRSRMADYRRVKMPEFYLGRVLRDLGQEVSLHGSSNFEDWTKALRTRVEQLKPMDNSAFEAGLAHLQEIVARIQARGGKVVFVVMPTSGLVREMVERRYPRKQFWDLLVARTSAVKVHYQDFPALRGFECPDGSHLDFRDRRRFTTALVAALGY